MAGGGRSNADIIRSQLESWAAGRFGFDEEMIDPNAEVDMTERVMNPRVFRGYEGLRQLAEEMSDIWEFAESQEQRLLERGDEVLVVITHRMRGRASGVEFAEPVAQLYRLREGRIVHMKLLPDVAAAVSAFAPDRH